MQIYLQCLHVDPQTWGYCGDMVTLRCAARQQVRCIMASRGPDYDSRAISTAQSAKAPA